MQKFTITLLSIIFNILFFSGALDSSLSQSIPTKEFDTYKAMENTKAICEVSDFYDVNPKNPDGSDFDLSSVFDTTNLPIGVYYPINRKGEIPYILSGKRRAEAFVAYMKKIGLSVQSHTFMYQGGGFEGAGTDKSFIATYRNGNKEIWFLGHHDYIAGKGASDNSTSLGIMMELARVVVKLKPKLTVRFATFGMEEYGHGFGSSDFVGTFKNFEPELDFSRDNIKAIINMDCVGSGRNLLLVRENDPSNESILQEVVALAASLGHKYEVRGRGNWYSDHIWFLAAGFSQVFELSGDTEKAINHGNSDIPKNLKLEQIRAAGEIGIGMIMMHDNNNNESASGRDWLDIIMDKARSKKISKKEMISDLEFVNSTFNSLHKNMLEAGYYVYHLDKQGKIPESLRERLYNAFNAFTMQQSLYAFFQKRENLESKLKTVI